MDKSLIPERRSHLVLINKKKRTYPLEDFAVSANHKVKVKKGKNAFLKKLEDLEVTVVRLSVSRNIEKRLSEFFIIQTTALVK